MSKKRARFRQKVGPLGFEPRIACAPGMYPNPLTQETSHDTGFLGKLDDGPFEIHAFSELNETEQAIIKTLTFLRKAVKANG